MNTFFETSAFVKASSEEGSRLQVKQDLLVHNPFISILSLTEVVSALARLERQGKVEKSERNELIGCLWKDFRSMIVQPRDYDVMEHALSLLCNHTPRASDSIQLALYLVLLADFPDLQFLCFDNRLSKAAVAEDALIRDYSS